MPEGDTILAAARRLGAALAGHVVTAYRAEVPAAAATDLVGRTVERVDAHGKNLFVRFDDGRVLHSHLKMTGAWHVYRAGDRWRRPAWRARAVLEVRDVVAVCFDAPVIALISARKAERIAHELGPDVLAAEETFDAQRVAARLRARGDLAVGVAVMHQGLLAGIGNIYKSETLFECGVDPFLNIDFITDDALLAIVETARRLMQANVDEGRRRRTVGGGGYFVYERSGQPCRRCGTTVKMRRQGDAGRSTYYCPKCQRVPAAPGPRPR